METFATGVGVLHPKDSASLKAYDIHAYTFLQSAIGGNGLSSSSHFTIDVLPEGRSENFIYTHCINDIRSINTFFRTVNKKLVHGGTFIGCFESIEQRKRRILEEFPLHRSYLLYYGLDFTWKRVIPQLNTFKSMHLVLTGGVDRVLSTTEVLGRLTSCGFNILYTEELGGVTYFYARKDGFPKCIENPTYRSIVKLKRIGKDGKFHEYYKLRTMYPYSEFLQEYLYDRNGTENGDKIRNDFRITRWGRLLRRFWIDEIPMLINYFRGDLKLVGVRPISEHKFKTYPEWLQKRRIKYKPGLIPPFYVDLPETIDQFMETEKRYLDLYDKSPFKTDTWYFFKALYNIIFKGARSR